MSHGPLHFVDASMDLSAALQGSFNLPLVLLSLLVASVAGYAALLISERISHNERTQTRIIWLSLGAVAMGCGIWTMHFVGMLAFRLPVPVAYDPVVTLVSILPGIVGSAIALHTMSRTKLSFARLNLGGILLGGAIGAMHYTGMMAMVMPAKMLFHPGLFALSILVAHGLATFALYVKFGLNRSSKATSLKVQLLSAGIMGCAVAGMHYTAMMASVYLPGEILAAPDVVLDPDTLGLAVSLLSTVILATAIISTIVDRRLQGISDDLHESEERTRQIVQTAGEGIISVNDTGQVITFNTAAAGTFGYLSHEVLGHGVDMLIPDSSMEAYQEMFTRYCERGGDGIIGVKHELEGRRCNDKVFPLSLTVTECSVRGQRAFTGIVSDLTEQRALESQLLQAQKLESIGELAAGIAHEINTPAQYVGDNLQFISSSFEELARVLKEYGALITAAEESGVLLEQAAAARQMEAEVDIGYLLEEIPQALGQSRDGMQRITDIVSAMKNFSHPGSRDKQPIDINCAIESTVTVSRNEWKYVAEVQLDLDPNVYDVPCVAAEFNQVILNIVVNAAHALSEGNTNEEKGTIQIQTRREGDSARIDIRDTGPGIPQAIRERIFDPFFTTKGVGKGTGQGLAIARSVVVDKHGGTIDISSEEGVGTTFTIHLPMNSDPSEDEPGVV